MLDRHTALVTIRIVHSDDREVATDVASAPTEAGIPDGVLTVCAPDGDMAWPDPPWSPPAPRIPASSTKPSGATSPHSPARRCRGGPTCCACPT
ncbi:hypothetical protein GCM10012280_50140 [Wenjunlia tyrosinilytica]|uniref:Uncharacterized protein n=1 Tax=Wenjunlia tyrosinilytica TaxID=1544741 RepID=A0A917ZVP7_9ACTN|nr:hypothetical protein GCM10012280_50140 [Wenjunlia tyrosinilytica]